METIDNFVAGSASTHDTIQFAANQVGSDAVIRFDRADSITLVGVTSSSRVAADFKFV